MTRTRSIVAAGLALAFAIGARAVQAEGPPAETGDAQRGRDALTLHGFLKPVWSDDAYKNVGKLWGAGAPDPDGDPEGFAAAFRDRYGLNEAPYPNDGLPMGLRKGELPDGTRRGIQIDCLLCHGGSIGGKPMIGLGNARLDLTLLFKELTRADGRRFPLTPYVINSSRGTVNAGMFSAVLLSIRNTDLSLRSFPIPLGSHMPEMDTPPWWNLGAKDTMYYDGRTPAASTRTNMQFLLGEKSLDDLKALEPTFRDIQAFIKSIEPPPYPFPIDRAKAERGALVFEANCKKCHGTYGDEPFYPNVVVALDVIGTDPARAVGMSERMVAHYNATWLGADHPGDLEMKGYQAPPLRGIWATAPYLHNGSIPTLEHLLNSPTRPSKFLRPPSTDYSHYDRENVGWTFEPVESSEDLTFEERQRFFDASRFGLGNGGHEFGDKLDEVERGEVIEYLKTL